MKLSLAFSSDVTDQQMSDWINSSANCCADGKHGHIQLPGAASASEDYETRGNRDDADDAMP